MRAVSLSARYIAVSPRCGARPTAARILARQCVCRRHVTVSTPTVDGGYTCAPAPAAGALVLENIGATQGLQRQPSTALSRGRRWPAAKMAVTPPPAAETGGRGDGRAPAARRWRRHSARKTRGCGPALKPVVVAKSASAGYGSLAGDRGGATMGGGAATVAPASAAHRTAMAGGGMIMVPGRGAPLCTRVCGHGRSATASTSVRRRTRSTPAATDPDSMRWRKRESRNRRAQWRAADVGGHVARVARAHKSA
jgi:hypothetical protein